jgi:beta-lactamase class A
MPLKRKCAFHTYVKEPQRPALTPRARRVVALSSIAAAALLLAYSGGEIGGSTDAHQSDGTPSTTAAAAGGGPLDQLPAGRVSGSRQSPSHSTAPRSTAKADPDTAVGDAVKAATASWPGHLSLAIADLDSGASAVYAPDGHEFATASIAKVDILATALLHAERAGRTLTPSEQADARRMIEASDNDAADRLWSLIGSAQGAASANKTFGLARTTPGDAGHWGLTMTTAADQLRLLRAVTTSDSPLSASSRSYLDGLMSNVEPGQGWGVSACADPSTSTALKNGWLPRSATGLWVVNSIGSVRHNGHHLLIAALSDDQKSQEDGIHLVETATMAAAKTITALP